jgi:hypothetical protein
LTKFEEWGAQPEGIFSPMRSHFYWPFLCSVFFLQFVDWNGEFVRLTSELEGGGKKHESTTYTLAVRETATNYYSKLPLARLVRPGLRKRRRLQRVLLGRAPDRRRHHRRRPLVFLFARVCLLLLAAAARPPLLRLRRRIRSGQTPVTFQEEYGGHVVKGTDMLIFH